VSTFVVGETFEHDHHVIDEQFAQFKRGLVEGEWLEEPFNGASEGLRHHIYVEEESLFPFLRVGGLVAPAMVMLREHGEIWQALDSVDSEIRGGRDASRALAGIATLESALEQHNMKEERILYPASGQVLSAANTEAVRVAFESGKRPDGWLPGNLRR
jgi:iron-sulfur cluster repair protein YtfE (RIC family)